MRRLLACVCAIGAIGCSPQPLDPARVRRNLAEHMEQVRRAVLYGDHRGMVDLTVPALVDSAGGKEGFVQLVTGAADEMRSKGFSMVEVTSAEPSELVESRDGIYAIVPYDIHMTGPGGATGVKPAYMIAMSMDGGRVWKFIDGGGAASDRATLRKLLPDFPDRLALPPEQKARWKTPGLLDWIKGLSEKPK